METKDAIKKARKAKGYSQHQVADILKTTQQQYSKYETGAQEIPIRHIVTLCKEYKITANKLIGIDIFMTTEEDQIKFEKLFNRTMEIIEWAEDQGFISENGAIELQRNIYEEKEEIEKE